MASHARPGSSVRRSVVRVAAEPDGLVRRTRRDVLATEEPLTIRVGTGGREPDAPLTVTMRTPGHDFELAAGFLYGEGVVAGAEELASIRYCVDPAVDGAQRYNVVNVGLAHGVRLDGEALRRNFLATSACGVCGRTSIESVLGAGPAPCRGGARVTVETLLALPDRLREAQALFERTGGLHAAALFSTGGELIRLREDVGRHNAMDKLVGASLMAGELPLSGGVVMLSGRLSFELVQKAVRAGVSVLAAVSAPSSLAVELAESAGITLVGFVRERSLNVYTGAERVLDAVSAEVAL